MPRDAQRRRPHVLAHQPVPTVAGLVAHGDGDGQRQGGERRPPCPTAYTAARWARSPSDAGMSATASAAPGGQQHQHGEEGEGGVVGHDTALESIQASSTTVPSTMPERVLPHVPRLDLAQAPPRGPGEPAHAVDGPVDDLDLDHRGAEPGEGLARSGDHGVVDVVEVVGPLQHGGLELGALARRDHSGEGHAQADHGHHGVDDAEGPLRPRRLMRPRTAPVPNTGAEPAERVPARCATGRSQRPAEEGQHRQHHQRECHHPGRLVRRRRPHRGPRPDAPAPWRHRSSP